MSSSKAFLFGRGDQIMIWAMLAVAAGCLAALGLVAVNLVALHTGGAALLPGLQVSTPVVFGLAGIGLVALALVAFGIGAASARAVQAGDDAERQRRDQSAVLRLVDEMGALADGDLTVRATVTEDITGAIADSLNDIIEALRTLVTTIDDTAGQVATASDASLASARDLVQASQTESEQVTQATDAVQNLVSAMQSAADECHSAEAVTGQSETAVHKGSEAVARTVEGMGAMREQIQDTGTRIKRLGQSSREIGDIVELINDISEQTNTLALNASIQAAAAGEAGEGFAVVADEVQRLAERAGAATRQVDHLVGSIQADANEAAIVMEKTTDDVAKQAQVAEDAGEALTEIESVAGQVSQLVRGITARIEQERDQAQELSGRLDAVRESTEQTEAGARTSGDKLTELTELGSQLRESVGGFTLPERSG